MLQFVLQKLRNKKWLIAGLLIGNLLLVSIAAAGPMYTKASLQRILTRTMSDYAYEKGHYPTSINLYSMKIYGSDARDEDKKTVEDLGNILGVEPVSVVCNRYETELDFVPELERPYGGTMSPRIGTMDEIEDHIEIVSGSMFSDKVNSDGTVDVIISEKCMVSLGLMQGEVLSSLNEDMTDDGPLRVRIAGVFRAVDETELYWFRSPAYYDNQLFISESVYSQVLSEKFIEDRERLYWFWIFDYNDLTVDNCAGIAAASRGLDSYYRSQNYHSYSDEFSVLVEQYEKEAAKVKATLAILQVPIYVLLAAFIFMVSRQILELEASEIAVIKSRGAAKKQIITIYALQSAIIAGASLIAGIPLSALICRIIGSANAFLEFVSRSALRIHITGTSLLYALAAAVVSMAVMVLPVLRYSSTTIVSAKQKKTRKKGMPLWQKLCPDLILIAVSLYGLYSFNGQKAQITEKVQNGEGLDPLIYLVSSLFIVGCGLLVLRIIPLIIKLVYAIGKKKWKPAFYASYLWLMRSEGRGYIMTFLVVTIALGIFNASVARTVNSNETDRITYLDGGADVVLMEKWSDNSAMVEDDSNGQTELFYTEPDFNKYLSIPNVASVTRVFTDDKASVSLKNLNRGDTVSLMGIHTKEFGETASIKSDLLPNHFYEYLNAISQKSSAILVSSNFRDLYGFELGDTVMFRNAKGRNANGVIYGFVDYWPTYKATATVKQADGSYAQQNNLLIVANLNFLQSQWGVTPYQVWLRTENGDTSPIYDFVEEQDLTLKLFRDSTADLVAMKNDPGIQGTNGILTVGFMVALVLCTVGFLIYWIFAVKNRALQFGAFRAMGMTMKEISLMLFNEQLYISGLSVAFGVGVGILASKLFVPLVQLAYAKAEAPLPLQVSPAGGDIVRLLIVMLLVIAACLVILGAIIRRMKIDQALKLGED